MFKNIKLQKADSEVFESLTSEFVRQNEHIELIASENYVSPAVMQAMGSVLTNKYAEGYPGKRYYGGCKYVDQIEQLAIDRLKQLFGANYANVQPHSGANANTAVYVALLEAGDTILGMNLSDGGHLTHGSKANVSGKIFNSVCYGVDSNGYIDYSAVRALAREHKPKIIVAGASAYSRKIDFKKFRKIADEVGAYLLVDMAHIAGLVATGLHASPVGIADVVTSTTHKTLRGPRGGIILCNDEAIAKKINSAIFPGTQGGPLEHVIAAKAVAFKEALQPSFKRYQRQIIKNAKALASALISKGIKIVSGGTDNHLMLIDLTGLEITGKELENLLEQANISTNKNTVPNEKRSPFVTSGLRVGTPAVTTRGMKEPEMEIIAGFIARIIKEKESAVPQVKKQVLELCNKFKVYSKM